MSMSAALPTGRRGAMLAFGITLAVLLGLWIIVVAPLAGVYADKHLQLVQRQALAQHMEQLAATRPALEARVAQAGPRRAVADALSGDSTPVATAALQGQVQDIAASAGVSLTSVESLPAGASGGYRRIGLKLAFSAPWPNLIHFLQALAQFREPLAIDDVQIRASSQTERETLDIAFSLYAPAGPVARDAPPGGGK